LGACLCVVPRCRARLKGAQKESKKLRRYVVFCFLVFVQFICVRVVVSVCVCFCFRELKKECKSVSVCFCLNASVSES
jgi:hypothetical protein